MLKNRNSRSTIGFTLIELMVVVAILGVLGLVVATNVMPYFTRSQQTVAKTNIDTLKATVQKYRLDNFRLPDNLQILLEPNEHNADEPYLESTDILFDPWGNEFLYIVESSKSFEIKSLGSDNVEGGDGDARDISSKDTRHDTDSGY